VPASPNAPSIDSRPINCNLAGALVVYLFILCVLVLLLLAPTLQAGACCSDNSMGK
jgi:hypothetical protein